MTQIKSGQADRFAAAPDTGYAVFLVYGPDSGLVSERAERIANALDVDLSDPFAHLRLDADQLAADPPRLADEANAISMFGGNRLLRVSGVTRRNLADCVKGVLEHPPSACWIIIEAGDLKPDAALRKLVEKHGQGVAIPCYADGPRELRRLIDDELSQAGLAIDKDAAELLASLLGGDRMASRGELAKLALYCAGKDRVTVDDIRAIIGDSAQLAIDSVVDAAISGDIARLEEQLVRLESADTAPDMVIIAALRHFQALQSAGHAVHSRGQPAKQAAASIRPPLHFSRRDAFELALTRWQPGEIAAAIARLDRAAFDCRSRPALANSMAGTALLAIAAGAARAARGRTGTRRGAR